MRNINKSLFNLIKKELNIFVENRREIIKKIDAIINLYINGMLKHEPCNLAKYEDLFKMIFGKDFSIGALTTKNFIEEMKTKRAAVEMEIAKIETIQASLKKDGMVDVVFGLPFLCFAVSSWESDLSYIMLNGIKLNGIRDKYRRPELVDSTEEVLTTYESMMSQLVEDDYTISFDNAQQFIVLYISYLTVFHNRRVVKWSDKDDLENQGKLGSSLVLLMRSLIGYLTFCETGHRITLEESNTLVKEILAADKNKSLATVTYELAKSSIEKYRNLTVEIKEESEIKESVDEEPDEEEPTYEETLAALRTSRLTDEELELYSVAQGIASTESIRDDIDAILAMLLEVTNEEDEASLLEDLSKAFASLLKVLESASFKKSKVAYYTEAINGLKTPKVMSSLIEDGKGYYELAKDSLHLLEWGMTDGDALVKAQDLPCPIWMKGRRYRVLYTKVEDIAILIDCGKAEDILSKLDVVRTDEFQEYYRKMTKFIRDGGEPLSQGYGNAIFRVLVSGASKTKRKN